MELYLEPIKFTRNAKNGKFLKGHEPFNKGKKMTDYLTEEKIQLLKSNLKRTGRNDIGGWNKKKIIGVKNGNFTVFDSILKAACILNLHSSNISKCCIGKRKTTGGINWFFEDSNEWINLINNK